MIRLTRLPLLAAVIGCSATEPQPVSASLRFPSLTAQERAAWPGPPTVVIGSTIRIRGTVVGGCGELVLTASRRGSTVSVSVLNENAGSICVGDGGSYAYEVELAGLPAGSYLVRARATGHDEDTYFSITVA